MKHTKTVICLMLGFLLLMIIAACLLPEVQLQLTLNDYARIVERGIPEDLLLTIYYMDPLTLTQYPYSVDHLKRDATNSIGDVKVIAVDFRELAEHMESLRKMDASVLQLAEEKGHLNARLYYVFETADRTILEVALSSRYYNEVVFVNGIEVEYNQALVDVIAPFITEEMYNKFK